jgi:anti-sigma-K factor RskA
MSTPSDEELNLLIAYALDTLDPEEAAQVDQLLAARPELRATVAELRATLDKLPYALPEPAPPADLRARTLARATRQGTPAAGRNIHWWRRLTFAFGGLAGALAVAVALLAGQVGEAQRELGLARTALGQLAAEREQLVRVVSGYQVVGELAGSGGRGAVLRTPGGDVVVAAQLAPLPAGRVYQLWLIDGEGAPVSGGTFTVDADGYGLITVAAGADTRAAQVFAVTAEPGPDGSPGPTSDPILVGGPAS